MPFRILLSSLLFCLIVSPQASAQDANLSPKLLKGLSFRNLTPAKTGGRISDIEVDPTNRSRRFVAVASGHVWRTMNAGTTWEPIFENYGSYSIGTLEIDPNDPMVIWLGTGENNAQRSVSKGDGIYKSLDGGDSWIHMGLKTSAHIGKIVIDPRNSNVVYVAAQGGVWAPGGERGLYKTTDGGDTWERVLHISENTGISDIIFDPRNPDVLLVSSYQRRRHVGKLVAGGPDGGIWKSTDAGANWRKLKNGLPGGDLGRIGLAISPQRPDVMYALIAGTDDTKGFYRSANGGEHWEKRSDYMVIDAQYYMELFPDPHQFDKVYSVNVMIGLTEDGGKTWQRVNSRNKHVDNHEIVFDPDDPNYLMVGCDGGIYESWDGTKSWRFTDNLPLTQFYRVGIDNAKPFYHIYGGTQDNATLGAPSRTTNPQGIRNGDWYNTVGGDGFQTRVDPDNPDIVYSESQYGVLVRLDKKRNERIRIQPLPASGEAPLRWHWNAPLLISPHQGQRLYFAANKIFRSDDRGESWTAISGDLSREIDRNRQKVMDRVWGVDAIFKNVWTSPYGTIVAMDESPIQEGLLYAGTDDGLVQISEDGGKSWRKVDRFRGVPDTTYVADIHASRYDANTVFVLFNNHKRGDFKPYVLKSTDRGKSWTSITQNLPKGEFVWSIMQDHKEPNLLFLGTEYGLHTSVDGGEQWTRLQTGMPTIAIRDLEIHQGEDDLIAASFGRGFYILDDYSPLRGIAKQTLGESPRLFPVANALLYMQRNPDGNSLGDAVHRSPNPDFGALISYYLPDSPKSRKQMRKASERAAVKEKEPVYYPDWDELAAERREDRPRLILTITDSNGKAIRRLTGPLRKGIQRVAWDLRRAGVGRRSGPFVLAGEYRVQLATLIDGEWTDLKLEQSIKVVPLHPRELSAATQNEMLAFQQKVHDLQTTIRHTDGVLMQNIEALKALKSSLLSRPETNAEAYEQANQIQHDLQDLDIKLNGNALMVEKMELIAPSIDRRVGLIVRDLYGSTAPQTPSQEESYQITVQEFTAFLNELNQLLSQRLRPLVTELKAQGESFDGRLDRIDWNEK